MGHIHRLLDQSADQSVNGRGPATRVTRVPRVPRKRAGVADDHLSSIAATRAGLARASSAASPVRASRASVARRLPTEWRAGAPVLPVDIVHGLHFGSVSRYTGATYPSARGTTEGQHPPPRPSDAPSPKQQDHGGARDRPSNERGTAASVAARYRARICVVRVSRLTESVRSIACLLPLVCSLVASEPTATACTASMRVRAYTASCVRVVASAHAVL